MTDKLKTCNFMENENAVQCLLEYGVLISNEFKLSESNVEKNMAEFCNKLENKDAEVLDILKSTLEKYNSKEDLKNVSTLSFNDKEIKLNGYGLLRIFENNLINNPSPEISNLFRKLNSFKNSGQLTRNTDSVNASLVLTEISQAPELISTNSDKARRATNSSDISGAGVGLRLSHLPPSQISPPTLSNSMEI